MSDINVAIARRWFEEVWNRRREASIHEMMTPVSLCYTDDGPIRGPDEFKERLHVPLLAAFPDLRVEVEATLARDDQVVVRWTASARHTGDGLGFRATHENVSFRGITWIHVRDGRMMEGWQSSNIPEVIRGLAAVAPS
jgi:predicted ester cyclase